MVQCNTADGHLARELLYPKILYATLDMCTRQQEESKKARQMVIATIPISTMDFENKRVTNQTPTPLHYMKTLINLRQHQGFLVPALNEASIGLVSKRAL